MDGIPLNYSHPSYSRWSPEDWTEEALLKLRSKLGSNNNLNVVDRPFAIGGWAALQARKQQGAAFVFGITDTEQAQKVLKEQKVVIGGRTRHCREWVVDLNQLYCVRCLTPGHMNTFCRNAAICKYCFGTHR